MQGQVVHGRGGRREQYRPIASRLCAGSAPGEVLAGLLRLHDFACVYVADLDAILGRGQQRAVIDTLQAAHPHIEFWLDAGFTTTEAALAWNGPGRPVLGSESLRACDGPLPEQCVLSLDFRDHRLLGPAGIEQPDRWPGELIAMTLARVGSEAGPDLARLAALRAQAPASRLYVAGGVRHAGDLAALAEAGAAGVLLATALHAGILGRDALAAFG